MWLQAWCVRVWWVAAVAVVCVAHPASAYTVTLISSSDLRSTAYNADRAPYTIEETVTPDAFPYVGTTSVTHGGSSATTTFDFSNAGLFLTFEHQRPAIALSGGQSYGWFDFVVDEPVAYAAHGAYAALDPDGRRVLLDISLRDTTSHWDKFRFDWMRESTVDANVEFGVDPHGRDPSDDEEFMGQLLPGRLYQFGFNAFLHSGTSSLDPEHSASGSGSVSLVFTPVPEPGTGLLVALGVVAMGCRRRRVISSVTLSPASL